MSIRLNGSTSGYTEIDAPAVAGSNTLVLPTGNGSADQALVTNGSGTLSFADRGRMTLATAQASTSGTSIDFTSIPSWVKRVTVMFSGVSTSGTSNYQVQLGSTSFTTSGYSGASVSSGGGSGTFSSGFVVSQSPGASTTMFGSLFLTLLTGNTWVAALCLARGDAAQSMTGGGAVTLSGTLDRVRITTVNGTDTFDAGSINILMEG